MQWSAHPRRRVSDHGILDVLEHVLGHHDVGTTYLGGWKLALVDHFFHSLGVHLQKLGSSRNVKSHVHGSSSSKK